MKLKMGSTLLNIRERKNMTQDAMAKLLAMTTSSYARLERGDVSAHYEDLPRFAAALDVPIQELIPDTQSIYNNMNNSSQSGFIFGSITNHYYYHPSETSLAFQNRLQQLEAENAELKRKLGE